MQAKKGGRGSLPGFRMAKEIFLPREGGEGERNWLMMAGGRHTVFHIVKGDGKVTYMFRPPSGVEWQWAVGQEVQLLENPLPRGLPGQHSSARPPPPALHHPRPRCRRRRRQPSSSIFSCFTTCRSRPLSACHVYVIDSRRARSTALVRACSLTSPSARCPPLPRPHPLTARLGSTASCPQTTALVRRLALVLNVCVSIN